MKEFYQSLTLSGYTLDLVVDPTDPTKSTISRNTTKMHSKNYVPYIIEVSLTTEM